MAIESDDKLLKPKAVCERLGCSLANFYALIASKQLGAFRVGASGKCYRVSEAQLQKFLDSRREHPGKNAPPFPKKTNPRLFKHLDGDRLREAWKKQGIE